MECIKPIWGGQRATAERVKNGLVRTFDYAVAMEFCERNPAEKLAALLPAGKTNGQPKKHHAAPPPRS